MTRTVSDSDSVRRQNRGLVLSALRMQGAQSRTALASLTGLSHASMTAIMSDLLVQGLVSEVAADRVDGRSRGRPATLVHFARDAAHLALFEIDVNRARLSLVDYGGVLVDRIETALTPDTFAYQKPTDFLSERLTALLIRTPQAALSLRRVAISVQGILQRDGQGLRWSPIPRLAGTSFVSELSEKRNLPVTLHKRGVLLAEGARWLDSSLHDASVATVFIGSTVAMGVTFRGQIMGRGDEGATEFGHMNHLPNGALCRCGMRGCIEAYAADYAVLRTAFSVPETAPPAAAVPVQQYEMLMQRAEAGDRAAKHAFNVAGRAVGYGISRMLAIYDPSHILIVGPGARALELMRGEFDQAIGNSLVGKINGLPKIVAHRDETEPVFRGLLMKTLNDIDQLDFAPLPNSERIGPAA
ncbi:ROK family transcriptional regulator [Devosia sp. Leaf420]|uniref:ROK family transcriptional regulator n=1 Tax=Devosia sp. Leaf420 TaxID=1736374 RepID=UPI000AC58A8F|nr:ROK family transcriptional regulator [Devosia sp. Leaf420]